MTFHGSPIRDLGQGSLVVVSFPGVHGLAWNRLTRSTKMVTTCIFLPDENAIGFGEHVSTGHEGKFCHCHHLYNGPETHGCAWYELWMNKTKEAARRECDLLVVTKRDGSLGQSQKGEVHFLDVAGLLYSKMTITEWVMMYCSQSEQQKQEIAAMRCKAQRDKCAIERKITKKVLQAMKTEEYGIKHATMTNDRTPSESSPVHNGSTYGNFLGEEHQEIAVVFPRRQSIKIEGDEENEGNTTIAKTMDRSPPKTSVCFRSDSQSKDGSATTEEDQETITTASPGRTSDHFRSDVHFQAGTDFDSLVDSRATAPLKPTPVKKRRWRGGRRR
eukprot:Skav220503  [mRNA]  locus=scaffold4697:67386:68375:- [translate_table: standard]